MKSGSRVDVEHELRRLLPHRTPDHPLAVGSPSGIIACPRVPTSQSRPCSSMSTAASAPSRWSCSSPSAASIASAGSVALPRRLDRLGAGGMQLLARDPARSHQGM